MMDPGRHPCASLREAYPSTHLPARASVGFEITGENYAGMPAPSLRVHNVPADGVTTADRTRALEYQRSRPTFAGIPS